MGMQGLNYYSKDEIDEFIEAGTTLDGFTAARRVKLDGIEAGAEVNDIDTIKVNGTAQPIADKAVDITVYNTYYGTGTLVDDPSQIVGKMLEVQCSDFILNAGAIITVEMSEDSSSALFLNKMNVNDTGTKPMWTNGLTFQQWQAGSKIAFVYTGTTYYEIGRYGNATIGQYGVTRLSNVIGTSEITAATPSIVKEAYDLAASKSTVLDCYPVGSYYETSDTSFDPNTTWGGTWESASTGRWHRTA